ncbi:MAG: DUF4416 family protein [Deltaproteobacteria bacterium]|nr:DUF4416 family protein [Deltaproteobacteria bacterium]
MLSREIALAEVLDDVGATLAPPAAVSEELPFTQSAYYDREMGPGLRRAFGAVEGLWYPQRLPQLKLSANVLEHRWRGPSGRRVNLDPGLLSLTQVVLASGKPAGHRLHLDQGIHGEIEYVYAGGGFRALPWTYPDFRAPSTLEFFNGLRAAHRAKLRRAGRDTPRAGRRTPDDGRTI